MTLAGLVCVCACGKTRGDVEIATDVGAATAATAAHSQTPDPVRPSPPGTASGARPAGRATAWRGAYRSEPGSLYIPPEWKDVHWKVKDSTAGIGEGAMSLQVDPLSGRVLGTLDGPLGPATIDGYASNGKLTAKVGRQDPADQGFAGIIVAALADGGVEGTMNVSLAEASAVRTATFALSPDGTSGVPR
jgi:hypothetical protein